MTHAHHTYLLHKYGGPAPRYTSYPTAPHFHSGVGPETYAGWLCDLAPKNTLSLYAHIPFCDTLCWFCGCHTKATRQYAPVQRYLEALGQEIEMTARMLPDGPCVRQIHWGGGSPTLLAAEDIEWLAASFRSAFALSKTAEFAVEIDPRGLDEARIAALVCAGVTRASVGVQDLDLRVQSAINRVQSAEMTASVIERLRAAGIASINIDLMYGLPHQTELSVETTVTRIAAMRPDRIALFGYAHVPWLKTHQRMIKEAALPSLEERFTQFQLASALLVEHGYRPVGLDHFALPDDPLAVAAREMRLRRNFQGYTTDDASTVIGLGASAIGSFPEGYVQNAPASGDYQRRINEGCFATVRGVALTDFDAARRRLIESLLCHHEVLLSEIEEDFGIPAAAILPETGRLNELSEDGLILQDRERLAITEAGRPFVRAVCARFDDYLERGKARHSLAV